MCRAQWQSGRELRALEEKMLEKLRREEKEAKERKRQDRKIRRRGRNAEPI